MYAQRNYRFYLSFVISALVLFAYLFAFSVWRIHAKSKSGLLGMLKNCPETVALVSFSFAAIWFLAGLAIFHIYLIAVNQVSFTITDLHEQNCSNQKIITNVYNLHNADSVREFPAALCRFSESI